MKYHLVVKRRPGLWKPIGFLLACAPLCGSLGAAAHAAAEDAAPKTGQQKVLFLGNSITLHGPAPAIGWSGNWGMAASTAEKDFVHIVTRSLARTAGTAPEVMIGNIATFERQYATFDLKEKLKDAFEFKADLIIVAIGENVPQLVSEDAKNQFEKSMKDLLQSLKANGHPTIIVRSCFWPNHDKDEALKRACRDVAGTFLDIGSLSMDESNFARSEREFSHRGVAAHPGDRGMQAIADAILLALAEPKSGGLPTESRSRGRRPKSTDH